MLLSIKKNIYLPSFCLCFIFSARFVVHFLKLEVLTLQESCYHCVRNADLIRVGFVRPLNKNFVYAIDFKQTSLILIYPKYSIQFFQCPARKLFVDKTV